MSVSDSEASSHGTEYKKFRQVGRDRLLYEMLKSSKSSWKVLIMDKVTMKVMSASCKMADITDQGVSLVEQLSKRREPMPNMDVIYFIQPIKENLIMFISDMSGREPLYKKAFLFFSGPTPKDFITKLKADSSVVARIGALREMNLEYFPIDNQAFVTDHENALGDLYSENAESSPHFDLCLHEMATRIATVFASLKEFPIVRCRAKGLDGSVETTFRDQIPNKLASLILEYIESFKTSIPNFPKSETCDFLILDRAVDLIAPIIHEWTYDAMCHDLIDLDGNKYVQQVPSKSGGAPEKKEFLLEDHDPVWLEMRHLHIADASERLSDKMENLMATNKAAQLQQRDTSELSTRDIQKMVQALPAYNEQMEKLSLHVEIAGKINTVIGNEGLRDLGQIEQDLVFGDAGYKELLNFFGECEDVSDENRLRLMMLYASVDPERFEGDKGEMLMQVAKLSPGDLMIIRNMQMLEGARKKKPEEPKSSGFSIRFDTKKKPANPAARKDRTTDEEEQWALSRFYPLLEELLEKIDKNEMPKDEYQCMNEPSAKKGGGGGQPGQSRRSKRTAKPHASDDGNSSDSVLKDATMDLRNMGQRIFVFIIGGATRSELRVCHKLTNKLRREVVLGTTCIDDPPQFITKVKLLSLYSLLWCFLEPWIISPLRAITIL